MSEQQGETNGTKLKAIADNALMALLGRLVQLVGIPLALWWLVGLSNEVRDTRLTVERIDTELKVRVPLADIQHADFMQRILSLEQRLQEQQQRQ